MNMTYENLKSFDKDRKNPVLIKQVRQLLYDFSYSDLSKIFLNKDDCQTIRKSIINYLYSGSFTLNNELQLNTDAEKKLKAAIFKDYKKAIDNLNKIEEKSKKLLNEIQNIKSIKTDAENSFNFEEHFYNAYFDIWQVINIEHETFINSIELVNYLLIYEAPPFSNDVIKYKDKYFLTSNKKSYASAIKTCFNSRDPVKKVLIDNNVAYFDLIMGCLPIANEKKEVDLRKKWCYNDEFKIGGKALPIVLLELGICYVLKNVKKPIIKFPKIAIGAPVKTSSSIFEYYTDNPMKVLICNSLSPNFLGPTGSRIRKELDICEFIFLPATPVGPATPAGPVAQVNPDKSSQSLKDYTEILSIDISGPNSINGFKKYKKGLFLPLHKANIISTANSPNGDLLKNAFDNY